jgi:hypothetical protein
MCQLLNELFPCCLTSSRMYSKTMEQFSVFCSKFQIVMYIQSTIWSSKWASIETTHMALEMSRQRLWKNGITCFDQICFLVIMAVSGASPVYTMMGVLLIHKNTFINPITRSRAYHWFREESSQSILATCSGFSNVDDTEFLSVGEWFPPTIASFNRDPV